jgi:hypothetical protein
LPVSEHRHPVFGALRIPDDNKPLVEVKILDTQLRTFRDPQAAAVEQLRHNSGDPSQMDESRRVSSFVSTVGRRLGLVARTASMGSVKGDPKT